MAQHDFNIANAGGATVRADINNVLSAIQSNNSGSSAPSSTVAGMFWLDTSADPYVLKIRDKGNNHWLKVADVTDPGSDGDLQIVAPLETKGGTGQTSYTQGDILYSDGSNSLAKLGAGTSGQFLKTQGSGANPTWASVPQTVVSYEARQFEFSSATSYENGAAAELVASRGTNSSAVVPSFTAVQGRTYQIVFNFRAYIDMDAGVNSSGRNAIFRLYYGTTSRSAGDSTYAGTDMLMKMHIGRDLATPSTSASASYIGCTLMGSFYQSASDATTYVYFTSYTGDGDKKVLVYHGASNPMFLSITGYTGDLTDIIT
tara:strand:- start:3050 stop:3997 length:948 start_codon:yes stop_codon:yes gene_type:complete